MKKSILLMLMLSFSQINFAQNAAVDTSGISIWNSVGDYLYNGQISVQTQYGLLPASVNIAPPQSNTIFSGNLGVDVAKIPIKVSFHYSTLGLSSGIQNYFRFSFDANQYKKNLAIASSEKILTQKVNLDSLFILKKNYSHKLSFLKYMAVNNSINNDSNLTHIESSAIDSFGISTNKYNSEIPNIKNDSIIGEIDDLEKNLNNVNQLIQGYQNLNKLSKTDIVVDSTVIAKPKLPLERIKSFEIGLCYPNYSKFLVSNIPVSGVSGEFQYKKLYVAITYGKTLSNPFGITNSLLATTTVQPDIFTSGLNMWNNPASKTIGVIKIGFGKPKGSHFYIGGLLGTAKNSYSINSYQRVTNPKNFVGEIDVRMKLSKNHFLDLVYGKSKTSLNDIESTKGEESIFDLRKTSYSNALSISFLGKVLKTRTAYQLSYRFIDPLFESYGTGFLKSNTSRIKINISQVISKKIKVSGGIRYQYDDVRDLQKIRNTLFSYNASLTFRPNRNLLFKVSYKPFTLNTAQNNSNLYASNNNIFNAIATYTKRKKKNLLVLSGVYLKYNLNSSEIKNSYNNVSLTLSESIDKKWIFELGTNYYFSSDTTKYAKELLGFIKVSRNLNKTQVNLNLKNTINAAKELNYGASLGAKHKLYKNLNITLTAEKLLISSFYRNLGLYSESNLDYRVSGSLSLRW